MGDGFCIVGNPHCSLFNMCGACARATEQDNICPDCGDRVADEAHHMTNCPGKEKDNV